MQKGTQDTSLVYSSICYTSKQQENTVTKLLKGTMKNRYWLWYFLECLCPNICKKTCIDVETSLIKYQYLSLLVWLTKCVQKSRFSMKNAQIYLTALQNNFLWKQWMEIAPAQNDKKHDIVEQPVSVSSTSLSVCILFICFKYVHVLSRWQNWDVFCDQTHSEYKSATMKVCWGQV